MAWWWSFGPSLSRTWCLPASGLAGQHQGCLTFSRLPSSPTIRRPRFGRWVMTGAWCRSAPKTSTPGSSLRNPPWSNWMRFWILEPDHSFAIPSRRWVSQAQQIGWTDACAAKPSTTELAKGLIVPSPCPPRKRTPLSVSWCAQPYPEIRFVCGCPMRRALRRVS